VADPCQSLIWDLALNHVQLYDIIEDIFGTDTPRLCAWFSSPNDALAGNTPAEMLRRGRSDLVQQALLAASSSTN